MSGSRTSRAAASCSFTSVAIRMPCVLSSVMVSGIVASSSERGCLVLAAQLVAHDDRRQVEQHDDDQQEDRGRVDHRLGGLDVGALEADVVDVEPKVHELAVRM